MLWSQYIYQSNRLKPENVSNNYFLSRVIRSVISRVLLEFENPSGKFINESPESHYPSLDNFIREFDTFPNEKQQYKPA